VADLTPTHLSLHLVRLPLRASLTAAHGVATEQFRELTLVGLHVDNDTSTVVGWGECSALNEPGYTPEWAEGAFDLLRSGSAFDRTTAPMATSAVEMALLDFELKQAGESLANRLGTAGQSAPAGAVVGLGPLPSMLDAVEALVAKGIGRIKIKVSPGRIVVPIEAIRSSFPDVELHIDANGSLAAQDLPALVALRDMGVRAVEQPFALNDRQSAARLVAETDMAIVADEAVSFVGDVTALTADKAATAVAIKPGKLGGLRASLAVLDEVAVAGMHASIGGMLESGLGRHVLAALAPLPVFTLTGDLSPAGRWLSDDVFRDISMKKGQVAAPSRPGIAGEAIKTRLAKYTVRHAIVSAKAALAAAGHERGFSPRPS